MTILVNSQLFMTVVVAIGIAVVMMAVVGVALVFSACVWGWALGRMGKKGRDKHGCS